MPEKKIIPKGCASSRGVSDMRHTTALGGQKAHVANRLYMLTVRRESLVNKRRSLKHRMDEIDQQIRHMEVDIRVAEEMYGSFKRMKKGKSNPDGGNGPVKKPMRLKY